MTKRKTWLSASLVASLVLFAAAPAVPYKSISLILLVTAIVGIALSTPPDIGDIGLLIRQLFFHYLAPILLLIFVFFGLANSRIPQISIAMSLIGLLLTRLDVVIGEVRFNRLETKILASSTLDIEETHRGIVHLTKHPTRVLWLMEEAKYKGVSTEQLCADADRLPHPGAVALMFTYFRSAPVLPKLFLELVVCGLHKTLKLTGGNSVFKLLGFLLLFAAATLQLALGNT